MSLYALEIQSPCQMMIAVYNHLLRKVCRFQYHSQKVIGSLGMFNLQALNVYPQCYITCSNACVICYWLKIPAKKNAKWNCKSAIVK